MSVRTRLTAPSIAAAAAPAHSLSSTRTPALLPCTQRKTPAPKLQRTTTPTTLFHLERKRTSLNSKAGENETRRFVLPAATGNQSVVKKIRCNQGDLLRYFRCRRRRCCPLSPRSSSYSSSSSIPPFLLHLFTLSSLFAIIILFHSIYLHKSIASFANSRQSTSSSCASERKTQRKG